MSATSLSDLQCLSDSALGSFCCGRMPSFTSSLLYPHDILSFKPQLWALLPEEVSCGLWCCNVDPRARHSRNSSHLCLGIYIPYWSLSAQILASYFCSVESFGKSCACTPGHSQSLLCIKLYAINLSLNQNLDVHLQTQEYELSVRNLTLFFIWIIIYVLKF